MTEVDTSQIEKIYEKELDTTTILKNPILRPIIEINNQHKNFERVVQKAVADAQEEKNEIDKMIEDNPIYSETIILAKFLKIWNCMSQIISSQDIQKDNMKKAINDMVNICMSEYTSNNSPATIIEDFFPKKIKGRGIFSELLNKEIPILEKKEEKKEEIEIPIIEKKEEIANA